MITKLISLEGCIWLCSVLGAITFSQGFSFARWTRFEEMSHYINFHAVLLGVCGFGLLLAGVAMKRLLGRVQALEMQLRLLNRDSVTGR